MSSHLISVSSIGCDTSLLPYCNSNFWWYLNLCWLNLYLLFILGEWGWNTPSTCQWNSWTWFWWCLLYCSGWWIWRWFGELSRQITKQNTGLWIPVNCPTSYILIYSSEIVHRSIFFKAVYFMLCYSKISAFIEHTKWCFILKMASNDSCYLPCIISLDLSNSEMSVNRPGHIFYTAFQKCCELIDCLVTNTGTVQKTHSNIGLFLMSCRTEKLCCVVVLFSRTMVVNSFILEVVAEIFLEIREQLNSLVIRH